MSQRIAVIAPLEEVLYPLTPTQLWQELRKEYFCACLILIELPNSPRQLGVHIVNAWSLIAKLALIKQNLSALAGESLTEALRRACISPAFFPDKREFEWSLTLLCKLALNQNHSEIAQNINFVPTDAFKFREHLASIEKLLASKHLGTREAFLWMTKRFGALVLLSCAFIFGYLLLIETVNRWKEASWPFPLW